MCCFGHNQKTPARGSRRCGVAADRPEKLGVLDGFFEPGHVLSELGDIPAENLSDQEDWSAQQRGFVDTHGSDAGSWLLH